MKFFKVTDFNTALNIVKDNFDLNLLKSERISLNSAVGRRFYSDITAPEDVPEYNRSTVDGYAVKASEVYAATESVPSILNLIGNVTMGKVGEFVLKKGETVYVPTGGAVPEGADAVVMMEYADVFGSDVAICRPVAVNENVIQKGDDVRSGSLIFKRGEEITPLKCGLMAALGLSRPEVFKPIKVGIISTGDEIVEIDKKTQIGQIRDANSIINSTLCKNAGIEVVSTELVKDGFDLLDKAVERALNMVDIVLVSGGSSIGTRDYTERVFMSRGEILVHGVALKPGKPTLIARSGDKLLFGLPGHPMACLLTLKLLVIGAIKSKFDNKSVPFVFARTTLNFPSSPGRLTVQPVTLQFNSNDILATPIFYKSGKVSALAHADGYTLIDENAEGIDKNQSIKVYLL